MKIRNDGENESVNLRLCAILFRGVAVPRLDGRYRCVPSSSHKDYPPSPRLRRGRPGHRGLEISQRAIVRTERAGSKSRDPIYPSVSSACSRQTFGVASCSNSLGLLFRRWLGFRLVGINPASGSVERIARLLFLFACGILSFQGSGPLKSRIPVIGFLRFADDLRCGRDFLFHFRHSDWGRIRTWRRLRFC